MFYYIISNFSNIFEFLKIFHPLSILILFAWAWQKQLGYVLISNTVSIYFWIFSLGYSSPSSLIWIFKNTPSCVYIHYVRLERDRNSSETSIQRVKCRGSYFEARWSPIKALRKVVQTLIAQSSFFESKAVGLNWSVCVSTCVRVCVLGVCECVLGVLVLGVRVCYRCSCARCACVL